MLKNPVSFTNSLVNHRCIIGNDRSSDDTQNAEEHPKDEPTVYPVFKS